MDTDKTKFKIYYLLFLPGILASTVNFLAEQILLYDVACIWMCVTSSFALYGIATNRKTVLCAGFFLLFEIGLMEGFRLIFNVEPRQNIPIFYGVLLLLKIALLLIVLMTRNKYFLNPSKALMLSLTSYLCIVVFIIFREI